ncbi:unnamed protein product [Paramecium sonneborni]|uniref:Uncharacterized protein n=1 Tax=Paramecium sonneborni TaxID=65129 RepID=A0A8S1L250_9CILI|nr:unnamed protein product [Paramecium sonneborni]
MIDKIRQVGVFDVQGKIKQNVLISNQVESHNPSEKYSGYYVLSQLIFIASFDHYDVKQTSNSNNQQTQGAEGVNGVQFYIIDIYKVFNSIAVYGQLEQFTNLAELLVKKFLKPQMQLILVQQIFLASQTPLQIFFHCELSQQYVIAKHKKRRNIIIKISIKNIIKKLLLMNLYSIQESFIQFLDRNFFVQFSKTIFFLSFCNQLK